VSGIQFTIIVVLAMRDCEGAVRHIMIAARGGVRANSRVVPAVLSSAHEQSVPIFQQLARSIRLVVMM
jgi:hypothetical protein